MMRNNTTTCGHAQVHACLPKLAPGLLLVNQRVRQAFPGAYLVE